MTELFAIGLDLGGTDLKAGLVTRAGELRAFLRRPSRALESAEAPLEVMQEAARELETRGARASVTLTLGTGLGCGIVLGGRVVHGAFGGAGEAGHLPLGSGESPCACGIANCVEPEASASGLVRAAQAAGLDVDSAEQVFVLAGRGEPTAVRLVVRMADRLGAVIAVIVDLINPEVVAIGGGVAQAGPPLFGRLRAAVDRYALASHRRSLRILPAALGERAG